MNPVDLVYDPSGQILKHLLQDSQVLLAENGTEVGSDVGGESYPHLLCPHQASNTSAVGSY